MRRPDRLYRVHPADAALLVIDMQRAFCAEDGCIEIPRARGIVPRINRLAVRCRELEVPVIWIGWRLDEKANRGLWPMFQPRSPVDSTRRRPPEALTGAGIETALFDGLEIDEKRDHVVWKRRYSPFAPGASRLPRLLRQLRRGTLLVAGVGTNVCCESTVRDAMMRDYRVVVVSDANGTVSPLFHEISLLNIRMFFGDVATTADVTRELRRAADHGA